MAGRRPTRSERLLQVVDEYPHIVIVTHDNPDPDAIATGWAVQVLIRERLGRRARIVCGGSIVRAENKRFVELLRPPIELVDDLEIRHTTAAILVDCSLAGDNHLLANETVRPVAVIDHHTAVRRRDRLPFHDVREPVAAAASIAASYLKEQGIEPNARLATALAYAIRTETSGGQFEHAPLDRSMLRWLAHYAKPDWIAEIANAPLPRAYYGDLGRALMNVLLYDEAAFCLLPAASGAEIVGEVADLLIRCDGVACVLCAAHVGDDLVVSVRTEPGGPEASTLVRTTLRGVGGGGGGHTNRAGGKIPARSMTGKTGRALEDELRGRWLDACRVESRRGVRLVPRPRQR